MKITRWILVLAVAVALSGVLFAGEGHNKCTEDTQTCLNMMAAKLKNLAWTGIEMDQDEETGKLTVTKVIPDSPAMEAGFQEGDVLMALNGIEYGEDKEKMYEARKTLQIGDEVVYTVGREGCCHKKGGDTELTVTLGELPDDVMTAWVGNHMLDHAVIEVAGN
jgi:hypothetical protein